MWDYSYDRVPTTAQTHRLTNVMNVVSPANLNVPAKVLFCPNVANHDSTKVSVTRRVCGYLGSPDDARPFNAGKQEEVKRRVKHLLI